MDTQATPRPAPTPAELAEALARTLEDRNTVNERPYATVTAYRYGTHITVARPRGDGTPARIIIRVDGPNGWTATFVEDGQ